MTPDDDTRCECCDLPTYSCGAEVEKAQRKQDEAADAWDLG